MTKLIAGILGTALLVGFTAVGFKQQQRIEGQTQTITNQEQEIDFLEESLEATVAENKVLLEENHELENQVALLRDSVAVLKSQVKRLAGKVSQQKKQLRSFDRKLKRMEQQYEGLKTEIAEIHRQGQMDQAKINALEAEKAQIRDQVETLNVQKDQMAKQQQATEAELLDRRVREARLQRINNIVNETAVEFVNVITRKKRYSKPVNRIRNGKGWKYTIVNFHLGNADPQALLDERFLLKIVNTDTHEILSYIESNPNFPNSTIDSKGVPFRFDGNLVEIAHFNNLQKKGKNYEIQIYYVDDQGKEYPLINGRRPLVVSGKVLEMGITK
ncbi:MAG: hypothetical protein AAFW73_10350 [Bacteroidota bacterium]